jgi:heme exporter protein D
MSFNSFQEFLAMGGHGLYVWLAYGITLVVFAFNAINPIIHNRRFMREQKQSLRRELARENTAQ